MAKQPPKRKKTAAASTEGAPSAKSVRDALARESDGSLAGDLREAPVTDEPLPHVGDAPEVAPLPHTGPAPDPTPFVKTAYADMSVGELAHILDTELMNLQSVHIGITGLSTCRQLCAELKTRA